MTKDTETIACVPEPLNRGWSAQAGRARAMRLSLPEHSRIALLSHCGTGNLGDEASLATVLQHIKIRSPGAYLAGLSMDPEESARRHGIPCFPMRQSVYPFKREWSSASRTAEPVGYVDKLKAGFKKAGPLFRAARAIRNAMIVGPARFIREIMFLIRSLLFVCDFDLIIICGGGQLLDWGGPWAFPYTMFKWTLLAKCGRAKCIFLNSGAGPLDASLSRWFVRRTLAMADYISLRDRASSELLRKIGFRGNASVVADTVWGLPLPDGFATVQSQSKEELVIGIAPMPYGDSSRHWVADDSNYQRLIDALTEFGGRMLERGHRIKLFSSDIWFDSSAIDDLDAAIHKRYPALATGRVTQETISGVEDLCAALSRVDCYVTCRFHGVIFASLLNVPTLALAPHPKVTTLMKDMGLSQYCVDITKSDADWLTSGFDRLVANRNDVKARIRRHVEQCQAILDSQLDCLFRASTETQTEDRQLISVRSAK